MIMFNEKLVQSLSFLLEASHATILAEKIYVQWTRADIKGLVQKNQKTWSRNLISLLSKFFWFILARLTIWIAAFHDPLCSLRRQYDPQAIVGEKM